MSRSRSSKNDWKRFNKFKDENEKLRKEVSKLRKVVSSLVVDRLEKRVDKIEAGEEPIVILCEICGNDTFKSMLINRNDGKWEIKICKSCDHRGQMKKMKN